MNLKRVMDLISLMEEKGIVEAEISGFLTRIRLRRDSPQTANSIANPAAPVLNPAPAPPPQAPTVPAENKLVTDMPGKTEEEKKAALVEEGLVPVQSPMVGTFYRAPAPGAPPYVEEGRFISQGDVVCIVEAMKLMNEIESEVAGRVRKILVENAEPVEFGQVLMLIEEPK